MMFCFELILLTLLVTYGNSQEKTHKISGRAIGSNNAHINDYPYTASLTIKKNRNANFVCGGFIVSKLNIITACHCINGIVNSSTIEIRVGSNFYYEGGTTHTAKNYSCHPNYEKHIPGGFTQNDIAVIELKDPIIYNESVQNISLYSRVLRANESRRGETAVQTGWGRGRNGMDAEILQVLRLPIVSKIQCRTDFADIAEAEEAELLFDDQMCAGAKKTYISESVCFHDSGSALVIEENGNKYAIGVTANAESSECNRPTYPNIFTEVAYHRVWLNQYLKPDTA